MAASSQSMRSEYHHFRVLNNPDVDGHLLDVQLDRLADLDRFVGNTPSGLPTFTVIAPGVITVTFENDSSNLETLGPAIFQLRGKGEITWSANPATPGWRLRELKWYADELSFLDITDLSVIVDSSYEGPVAERVRSRRVTGPSARTLCSPEPQLTVLGTGRYSLTFPSHSGAPEWWSHPVNIDIRDEIIINHHEDTPQWRFDEIREYVLLLADIHLEAVTPDPEQVGATIGGKRGTGSMRRSTWSPKVTRKASVRLAGQMANLDLERGAPTAGPRRASEPMVTSAFTKSALTVEPIQEVEASLKCKVVGHGVFELGWYESQADASAQAWRKHPARVQILARGAIVDFHHATPINVCRELKAAAVDLHLRLLSAIAEVSAVFKRSMPTYPMLDALLPAPDETDPTRLPPPTKGYVRALIEIHSKTHLPKVPPPDKLPRLVLDNPPANIYRLRHAVESKDDPMFDLTPSSGANSHFSSVSLEEIDSKALYFYALKELVGVADNIPASIFNMFDESCGGPPKSREQPRETRSPLPVPVPAHAPVSAQSNGTARVPSPTKGRLPAVPVPVPVPMPTPAPSTSPKLTAQASAPAREASPTVPSVQVPVPIPVPVPAVASPPLPTSVSSSPTSQTVLNSKTAQASEMESKAEAVDVGTLDVAFTSLDTAVRVYFVSNDEYLFEVTVNTPPTRIEAIGATLEECLGLEIASWADIKEIVRAYAPRLPGTALTPRLPDLEPNTARLAFSPRRQAPSQRLALLPELAIRQTGVYELKWPAELGITPTTYDFRGERMAVLSHFRTPNQTLVQWLGVVIKALFENTKSPVVAAQSPPLPAQSPPVPAQSPPMPSPTLAWPTPHNQSQSRNQSQRNSLVGQPPAQFPVPRMVSPVSMPTPSTVSSPPATSTSFYPPTTAFPVPQVGGAQRPSPQMQQKPVQPQDQRQSYFPTPQTNTQTPADQWRRMSTSPVPARFPSPTRRYSGVPPSESAASTDSHSTWSRPESVHSPPNGHVPHSQAHRQQPPQNGYSGQPPPSHSPVQFPTPGQPRTSPALSPPPHQPIPPRTTSFSPQQQGQNAQHQHQHQQPPSQAYNPNQQRPNQPLQYPHHQQHSQHPQQHSQQRPQQHPQQYPQQQPQQYSHQHPQQIQRPNPQHQQQYQHQQNRQYAQPNRQPSPNPRHSSYNPNPSPHLHARQTPSTNPNPNARHSNYIPNPNANPNAGHMRASSYNPSPYPYAAQARQPQARQAQGPPPQQQPPNSNQPPFFILKSDGSRPQRPNAAAAPGRAGAR